MKKKAASNSPKTLAKRKVKFAKRTPRGTYRPVETKKEATHRIRETANDSAIAEPVKRGKKSFVNPENGKTVRRPKPPAPGLRYGPARIPDEPVDTTPAGSRSKHVIPAGATHLMYQGGRVAIFAPIGHLFEFDSLRGEIKFGKLRANEDFVSLMPGEEGAVTSWKDGVTRHATGTEPGSGAKLNSPAGKRPAPPKSPTGAGNSETSAVPAKSPRPSLPISKPAEGSKTGAVWAACDALLKNLGRPPSKDEACKALPDHNPGTVGTQRSAWLRFNNLNK